MANPEHLDRLKQMREGAWYSWRREHREITPDLSGADLRDMDVCCADLMSADLSDADLSDADLRGINLRGARLIGAKLINADLTGRDISNMHGDNMYDNEEYLCAADLRDTDLSYADLSYADLRDAKLRGAKLRGAKLRKANLSHANLSHADLSDADLNSANLSGVQLLNTDFTNARLYNTIFVGGGLREARGLASVQHDGPSFISIDTLYKSAGKIPEVFLRGCGVPESFIVQIPALVAAMQPIQFYSCFISYSSKDHPFAERLHADLQSRGVRCWFAPEDLKIGDKFRDRIDESIRLHDKLLIVLSENSVASPWVSDEVESAIEREHREGRTVLFPIKIDDAVMDSKQAWAATIRRTRHIGDFTRWKDHDSYAKAFARLLRDLKAEEKKA